MSVKDKLQIILITYNRAGYVEKTFNQIFADNSPVKNCDFLVLDNNSDDETEHVVKHWQSKFSNITYSKNKYNLGISGNIAKAMEVADKDYVWIIGDDDKYDFSNWEEVEYAINNKEQIICIARYAIPQHVKQEISYQLLQLTFITGGIYCTKLFNDTTVKNAFDNIYTLFPHIAPVVYYLNYGGKIYVVDKAISDNGMDSENTDCSYTRGAKNLDDVYFRTKTMSWIVGYCNILSPLKDKQLREDAVDVAICYKDIYSSFENFYHCMRQYHAEPSLIHLLDVYLNVSNKHREILKYNYVYSKYNKFFYYCFRVFIAKKIDIIKTLISKYSNKIMKPWKGKKCH